METRKSDYQDSVHLAFERCQEQGLDSGLKATDLILIYFCDQNSDACEKLFTKRIADLLHAYIPGSQGTSLYVHAVFYLIEPFTESLILAHLSKCKSPSHVVLLSYICGEKSLSFTPLEA